MIKTITKYSCAFLFLYSSDRFTSTSKNKTRQDPLHLLQMELWNPIPEAFTDLTLKSTDSRRN
jgi:hypothetical protein